MLTEGSYSQQKKRESFMNNQIAGVLKKTTKALNMNKKVTTHTFRHTHITLLVEMNVSLKAIMKRVGHVDEKQPFAYILM